MSYNTFTFNPESDDEQFEYDKVNGVPRDEIEDNPHALARLSHQRHLDAFMGNHEKDSHTFICPNPPPKGVEP